MVYQLQSHPRGSTLTLLALLKKRSLRQFKIFFRDKHLNNVGTHEQPKVQRKRQKRETLRIGGELQILRFFLAVKSPPQSTSFHAHKYTGCNSGDDYIINAHYPYVHMQQRACT
jgi:hypothetical protein